ncbi:MAG TPA: carboxypeptidase-like regulatory domain-containing protein [Candidatus Angelobacter sp.]|nr:carboxypeptidase-like regulatory domain-containing protein [Candidatus Angelobacter sp.]
MRRLTVMAAILLAVGASFAVPTAGATAIFQRGQGEARTLIGHVLDDREQPLPKAIVYLKNTKNLAIKTYISEPDGTFRFSGLAPNIDYEVYAEHQGSRSDPKTLSGFDSRRQVNMTLKIKGK